MTRVMKLWIIRSEW